MSGPLLYIVSVPLESSPSDQLVDLQPLLDGASPSKLPAPTPREGLVSGKLGDAVYVEWPDFKTGTLATLLNLSDTMAKQDAYVTATLTKITDTLRTLSSTSSRSSPLASHLVMSDGTPYSAYLFPESGRDGTWNTGKYRTEGKALGEVVDALVKEANGVENSQRVKAGDWQLVRGQLQQVQRRKTGNLSMRSLADVVSEEDFAGTNESEYLETVLVAVPKNSMKEWETSYERLSSMVVPRSSTKLAQDDDYALCSVAIFRRIHDDFAQKCREKKFIVRDFTYNKEELEKADKEAQALEEREKELWTDVLRLSRINFAECFEVLIHLKVLRAYVESVLRYGLPASYFGYLVRPAPKMSSKLLSALKTFYASLGSQSRKMKKTGKSGQVEDAPAGEYATVLEGEYLDFVCFEVEQIE